MGSTTIDDEIETDLDHRIEEAVADWVGDLEDFDGLPAEEAEAKVADILEKWLDDRSASDWF